MLLGARTYSPRALGIPFSSRLVPLEDKWAPRKLVSGREEPPVPH